MSGLCEGRVVIVTGAGRGIGRAHALAFAREGARVVVNDLGGAMDGSGGSSLTAAEAVAEEIRARGGEALANGDDVSDWEASERMIRSAIDHFGGLDVLVNNAGILKVAVIAQIELDDYMRIVNVNQVGCLLGMKHAIPHMAHGGGGSIVNICSTSGMEGQPGIVAYTSTKWAIRGMTRTAAVECGPLNIRVNAILPGGINTEMGRGETKGFEGVDTQAVYKKLPLSRMGEPREIANLALFLASDDASYCTGSDFVADGGWTTCRPMF